MAKPPPKNQGTPPPNQFPATFEKDGKMQTITFVCAKTNRIGYRAVGEPETVRSIDKAREWFAVHT